MARFGWETSEQMNTRYRLGTYINPEFIPDLRCRRFIEFVHDLLMVLPPSSRENKPESKFATKLYIWHLEGFGMAGVSGKIDDEETLIVHLAVGKNNSPDSPLIIVRFLSSKAGVHTTELIDCQGGRSQFADAGTLEEWQNIIQYAIKHPEELLNGLPRIAPIPKKAKKRFDPYKAPPPVSVPRKCGYCRQPSHTVRHCHAPGIVVYRQKLSRPGPRKKIKKLAAAPAVPVVPQQEKDGASCAICLDARASCAAVPCGHLAYCNDCLAGLQDCAICRKPIEQRVQIYFT